MIVVRWLVVVLLLGVELTAVYAVLHPKVSPEYKAYYIDRTTSDWRPPHYRASPDQGIAFLREGWPDFVSSTAGFSRFEEWGRWTDYDVYPTPSIHSSLPSRDPFAWS